MTVRIKPARLDERSQLLLRTLSDLTSERQSPPTLAELGRVMGTGKSHIHEMMSRLEAFGLVEKRGGQWWPATYVILRLSDTKVRFLNRIRGPDSIEDAIAKLIEREMTRAGRTSIVPANRQEGILRVRQAQEDVAEEVGREVPDELIF